MASDDLAQYAGSLGDGTPSVPATPAERARGARSAVGRPTGYESRARRALLKLDHLGPLSVLRISLTFSLCMLVVFLAAIAALWAALNGTGAFRSIIHASQSLTTSSTNTHSTVADWLSFGRVMLIALGLGIVNVIAFTMLSTIGALFYNLSSDFIGGFEATLVERQS